MEKKYTIIHHISGESNLLMENISAFNEICDGAVDTKKINFVILVDMMRVIDDDKHLDEKLHYLTGTDMDYPTVYLVQKGDSHQSLSLMKEYRNRKVYFKNDSLASIENLKTVLGTIRDKYPADNYAYVYKGHGGPDGGDIYAHEFIVSVIELKDGEVEEKNPGPNAYYEVNDELFRHRIEEEELMPKGWENSEMEFFSLEDHVKPKFALVLFGKVKEENKKYLTYQDLSKTLKEVFTDGLSYVLLDCCWGMSLENIEIFRKNTRYLVASADESPALGIGYRQFGEFLSRNIEFNSAELAKMLVANYFTINYADYRSPVEGFDKMGVSLSCADTSKIDRVLDLLKPLFKELKDKKEFTRLINCAKRCRDYTYLNPLDYCVFNVDFVWFVENIIYEEADKKYPNDHISLLCFEIIKEIKLFLMAGFLGANYPDVEYGKNALGGRGLTFTFPKLEKYHEKSIMGDDSYEIFKKIGWEMLLQDYYKHLKTLDAETFEALTRVIENNMDDKDAVAKMKYLKSITANGFFITGFSGDAIVKKEVSDIKISMDKNAIDVEKAFNLVVDNLETKNKPLLDQYIAGSGNEKWKRLAKNSLTPAPAI